MQRFFFLSLCAVAGLFRLVSAVKNPCLAELCYDTTVKFNAHTEPTPTKFNPKPQTNAQRMALGMPPNPPSRRHRAGVAARAQSSPTPKTTLTGVIEVKRASDGVSVGYVSTQTAGNGMFKFESIDNAVTFSIEVENGATSASDINVNMVNSSGPLFGLVQGRDDTTVDIAHGSFNYLYFVGMGLPGTPPNSPPLGIPNLYTAATGLDRDAESSVWHVDLTTGEMTVQWTNSDSTTPSTQIFTQSGYLYAGGDSNAFFTKYPAPVTSLTLHFVQNIVI